MDMNILNILENLPIFEWYFNHKNFILGIISLVLLVILITSVFWQLDEQLDDNFWGLVNKDKCLKDAIIIGSVLIIGMLLNAAGMELKLKLKHMPILLFFYCSILLFFIQWIEFVQYKNTRKKIIKITFNIYIKIVECTLLILTLMNRLESIELVVAVLSIIVMRFFDSVLDDEKKLEILNDDILKKDLPVEERNQLFPSRKRQLDSICAELNQFSSKQGPYAVAISGKWGTGKTSFVNVLKQELKHAEFVYVKCAIGYDVKAILNEMSLQIMKKFKENGIFLSQNGIIEQYFKKVSQFTSDMGYNRASKILEGFGSNVSKSYFENKHQMNIELESFYRITKKTIYFIVDDMDRILDNDMKNLLFKVVRESLDLKHCVTLFLVDYEQLLNENMSKESLEKYVNYQYELCEVKYKEIVDYYLNVYLIDNFFNELNGKYMKDKFKEIRQYTLEGSAEIAYNITKQIKKLEGSEDSKKNKERIRWLKKTEKRLYNRMNNPRKVRRYLDSIEKMISMADYVWFQNDDFESNEYSKAKWTTYIIQIAFLRIFLNETYEAMIQAKDFHFFVNDEENNYIAGQVIDDLDQESLISGKESEVLRELVYNLYILDVDLYKSTHQRLLEEINRNEMKTENIIQYIHICMEYKIDFDRLNKVLDFVRKIDIEQTDVNDIIMEVIGGMNLNDYNLRGNKILKTARIIIDIKNRYRKRINKNIYDSYVEIKEREFVFSYKIYIINLLKLIYNHLDIEINDKVNTIDQLYDYIVKMNRKEPIIDIGENSKKIKYLNEYFKKVRKEIYIIQCDYARKNGLHFLKPVETMFNVFNILLEEPTNYNKDNDRNQKDINFSKVNEVIAILNRVNDIELKTDKQVLDAREKFIEIMRKIEMKFNDYSEVDKKNLVDIMDIIYNKLNKEAKNLGGYENEWKHFGIRLFRLKKYLRSDVMEKY